jgi:hypothetical protein
MDATDSSIDLRSRIFGDDLLAISRMDAGQVAGRFADSSGPEEVDG